MKIHICTQDPCPLKDKECADILDAGFTTHFSKNIKISSDIVAECFGYEKDQKERFIIGSHI
jgi:hypothetical protein